MKNNTHARTGTTKPYLQREVLDAHAFHAAIRCVHDVVFVKPVGLLRKTAQRKKIGNRRGERKKPQNKKISIGTAMECASLNTRVISLLVKERGCIIMPSQEKSKVVIEASGSLQSYIKRPKMTIKDKRMVSMN
jgi:hypothetical protein